MLPATLHDDPRPQGAPLPFRLPERPPAPPRILPVSSTPPPRRPDEHPVVVYAATLSTEAGRESSLSAIRTAAWLFGVPDPVQTPWHLVRYPHMAALRSLLAERYAPATANKVLVAVRGVLRTAWRLELIDTESYQRAIAVKAVSGERLPAGRALDEGEIEALFRACTQPHPRAVRDAALIAVLLGCGLRRAEAAALDTGDFDPQPGSLRVIGKGNRERTAHVNAGVRTALTAWFELRGNEPGPLFCPVVHDTVNYRRLTRRAILNAVRQRGEQARISRCTPHDLRRTFVTMLLDKGNDIAVVSRMAGHRNIATTTRYDRRGEPAERAAATTIHIPYQAPRPAA